MKLVSHITTKEASTLTLKDILRQRAAYEIIERKKYLERWA